MASVLISAGEAEYVRKGFEAGLRSDGRGVLDFRQVDIDTGVISQATGSARVRLGTTEVLVGVKAEVGTPSESTPGRGRLSIAVEFSPVASPSFQGRGGDELSSELTAMLQRAYFSSLGSHYAGLDLNSLSIVTGKSCWVLNVDVLVLAVGGAVVDAASIAVKAALATTLLPKVELVAGEDPEDEPDYEIDDDPSVSVTLDTSRVPLTVTVSQVGVTSALDLDSLEEACSSAALAVSVDPSGAVVGVTKRRAGGIGPETMQTFDGKEIPGKPQRQRKFRLSNVGARVWWFDTRVRAALASGAPPPRQVVVLGSGMDTRPWRCKDIPRDTRWFEVDLPDVVATKQRALSALGAELNRQSEPGARAVRHPLHASSWASLAADLSGESWVGDLRQLGFDPEVPTLWILEGLLMYLEPAGAAALLRTLSGQSAVGSTLLSHNVTDELVLGVADATIQAYPPYDMDLVATWHYGFPADPRPAFQDLGWRVTERSSRGEIARQIFGVESDAELEGCTQFDARLGCDIDRYSAFVAATVDREGHAVNN